MHGCPAVAKGVQEFIRHHSVDRHCTSDVHPPEEAVDDEGVVVTARVVIEGVDIVEAVVAAPEVPQLGDTCQLCIPLSFGMKKHPACPDTGVMAQPQPGLVPNEPGKPGLARTAETFAAMTVQFDASVLQQMPPVDTVNAYA